MDSQIYNSFSSQMLDEPEVEAFFFQEQIPAFATTRKTSYVPPSSLASLPLCTKASWSSKSVARSLSPYSKDRRRRPSFESQSYLPPHSQSTFNTEFPPTTMNNQNHRRTGSGRGTRSPSSKEMGEMLDSFMGYLASKSVSSTPPVPGSLPPSMINYRPPTQSSSDINVRRRNVDKTSTNPVSVINHQRKHQHPQRRCSSQTPQRHESLSSTQTQTTLVDGVMKDSWMALGSGIPTSQVPLQYSYDRNIDSSTLMASGGIQAEGGMTAAMFGNMGISQYPEYNLSQDQYFSNHLNVAQFAPPQSAALTRSMMDPILDMGLSVEGSLDENWATFLREYYGTTENGVHNHQA